MKVPDMGLVDDSVRQRFRPVIFIRGARQLVTLRGPSPRRGLQLSDLAIIPDGSLLIRDDKIVEVGATRRI